MNAKKILLAFEGDSYSGPVLKPAINLCRENNATLNIFFIQQNDLAYIPAVFNSEPQPFEYSFPAVGHQLDVNKDRMVSIRKKLEAECTSAGIHFNFFGENYVSPDEFLEETRYADLVIAGYKPSADNDSGLFGILLEDFNCPVLLMPENYDGTINRILFPFSGKHSDIQVIKQFTYLLSDTFREARLITIMPDDQEMRIEKESLTAYLTGHYLINESELYKGKEENSIKALLSSDNKNTLLLMGIRHRGFLSRLFSEGDAESLLHFTSCPLFINPA